MIQREISRVLVLNLSGKVAVLIALPRITMPLTEPSLLSRGTRRSDGVPGVRMGDPALLRVTDQRGAEISAEACQEGWEGVFVVSG